MLQKKKKKERKKAGIRIWHEYPGVLSSDNVAVLKFSVAWAGGRHSVRLVDSCWGCSLDTISWFTFSLSIYYSLRNNLSDFEWVVHSFSPHWDINSTRAMAWRSCSAPYKLTTDSFKLCILGKHPITPWKIHRYRQFTCCLMFCLFWFELTTRN